MTISRKRKRSITVDGVEYLWWVGEGRPDYVLTFADQELRVVLEGGDIDLCYFLGQAEPSRHVNVRGLRFRRHRYTDRQARMFLCPAFEQGGAITPSQVAALIRWATIDDDDPPYVGVGGIALSDILPQKAR